MPLTPEEQAELQALEAELEQSPAEAVEVSGLSEEEAAELAALEQEFASAKEEEKKPVSRKERLTKLQSALAGAKQGSTLGFYDEIMGGVNAAIDTALEKTLTPFMVSEEAQQYMESPEFKERYKKERDKIRADMEKAYKANPKSFTAGEVGAGVATTLIPGAGLAGKLAVKGATKLASAVKKAVPAAAGGAAGAGYSEAEKAGDIAKDAAKGAALGTALSSIAPAAGLALGKIGSRVGQSELRAVGITGQKLGKMSPEAKKELVKYARDTKVLVPSAEKTAANAAALRQGATEKMATFAEEQADKGVSLFNKKSLAQQLEREVLPEFDTRMTKSAARFLKDVIKDVKSAPEAFKEQKRLQTLLGRQTRANDPSMRDAARAAYRTLSNNVDDNLEELGKKFADPKLKERFRQNAKEYRLANTIAEAAERQSSKISGGTSFGDLAAVGVGGPTGLLAVAARKLSANYGPTVTSRMAKAIEKGDKVGNTLKKLVDNGKLEQAVTLLGAKAAATDSEEN